MKNYSDEIKKSENVELELELVEDLKSVLPIVVRYFKFCLFSSLL